jgi:hypothetical protein
MANAKPPWRKEVPNPGHFIGAPDCKFYRHTHVGKWCISTVGDYRPRGGPRQAIGLGRTYETMVFNMRSRSKRWQEQDFDGYDSEAAATAGHEKLVRKVISRGAGTTKE